MEKNNTQNTIRADYEERKQQIKTRTEIHYDRLENAVYNFQDAICDEHKQHNIELLLIMLNEVISSSITYFWNHERKEQIEDDEILLHENAKK